MAFENVLANYEAARNNQGMLRPDYYQDVFKIQNQLDAALLQKEAERIVNDPILLEKFLRESGINSENNGSSSSNAAPTVVNGTPTAAGILNKTYIADILDKIGNFAPGGLGMLASVGSGLLDWKAGSDFDKFNQTQDRNTQLMRGGGLTKSDMEGNVFGFNPSNNSYISSDGRSFDTSTMSPETQAGLAANLESFGTGTDKDYYGD